MYLLGTILIMSGIVAASVATVGYALVPGGNTAALAYGRIGTRAAFGAVLAVAALIMYLFLARRYDIQYVYDYSSADLEFGFRIAAMWAGQPGSFVVWALWGLIAAQLLVRRTRHAEPYVLSVLMLIQAALLVFMLVRNPFIPFTDPATGAAATPADGKGLNELLHNPWMIIHPPILFIGYALMAVPFAFAIGGLWRRDYDGWARAALPWALAAWSFLGLALLLGGYWAYETLNWGGYWGWDPVENSSLVPWLTTTALIHTLLIQRTSGGMRRANFALAILTYVLVFYATFLTRTGVLSSFSVHSFVAEGLKSIMTGFLAALALFGFGFLALRWRDIPSRPISEKLLSRDSFFVLMALGLLVIAGVITLGTSMPVISAIPGVGHALQSFFGAAFELDRGQAIDPSAPAFTDGRFGLVAGFYHATVPPLAIILVLLMIVGPLLGWRDTSMRHLLRTLRWPALAAVLVACAGVLLGARDLLPLAYIGLGAFAAGTNIVMIVRTLRGGWLRIGGYLAHVGLAVLLTGVVGSSFYATPELRLSLPQGQKISAYGYDFEFHDWKLNEQGRGVLDLSMTRRGSTYRAQPNLYLNPRMGATMATPSIKSEFFQDVYVSPQEYQPAIDRNSTQLSVNDKREIGPYTITFLGFDAAESHGGNSGDIGAQLKVTYQGQDTVVSPIIRLVANETDPAKALQHLPADLPGGKTVVFDDFNPLQRWVLVRVTGLDLPVEPAKAVITVSVKPGILLVWLGVIIGVLGGLIALVRRTLEGRWQPGGARSRLPRGLANLLRSPRP
ncbi:MAG: cytochrome c biogenesis protein CcsA [Kouleothrix sp.]|jgi:cytochrome c-type biogenesis protein CcmF|nr:cytochrome c biogenesis protein CcsA [Kouleothrix sp.]